MFTQTATSTFNPTYFAQKSLAASVLGCKPRQIESVEVSGDYALVLETGAVWAIAIPLSELEAEHDKQRTDRAAGLTVIPGLGDGHTVRGGREDHEVIGGVWCDCEDFKHQEGRDNPYCKHIAAVRQYVASAGSYRLDDLAAIASGEAAKADIFGW